MSPYGIVAPTHRAIRKYYGQVAALESGRRQGDGPVRANGVRPEAERRRGQADEVRGRIGYEQQRAGYQKSA